jgi:predicted HAD superfamily Cof-like phosphohydrolase
MTILEKIVQWNRERGLIQRGFNHQKETSFIIEELIESTGRKNSEEARDEAEALASQITQGSNPSDEALVDAFADIMVYSIGAIAKLGYNPDMVMDEVYEEINSRTGTLIDGKFVKDKDVKLYTADFSKCKK